MDHQPGVWSNQSCARLIEVERGWLQARRLQWPQGLELWVAPQELDVVPGELTLRVDDAGRLSGALRGRSDMLPFADATVQRIVFQHALDLRPAAPALLREAVRALAPGGILVVFGFDPLSPMVWRSKIMQRGFRRRVRTHFPARLGSLMRELGLGDVQRFGIPIGATDRCEVRQGGWPQAAYALLARKVAHNVIALRRSTAQTARGSPALLPTATRSLEIACR